MNSVFFLSGKEASSDGVLIRSRDSNLNTLFVEINPADFPIPQTLNAFVNEVNTEIYSHEAPANNQNSHRHVKRILPCQVLDTSLTQRRGTGTRNLSSSLFFDDDSSQYYMYSTQFFFLLVSLKSRLTL